MKILIYLNSDITFRGFLYVYFQSIDKALILNEFQHIIATLKNVHE